MLESLHPWIGVQELFNLRVQMRKIRLGMLQLIAENAQAGRPACYRSSTAHALIGQGHQFLCGRASVMGYWPCSYHLDKRFDPGFDQGLSTGEGGSARPEPWVSRGRP